MKKLWCIILLILLLTGCSKQTVPLDRPHSLEVEYGDSGIFALTSTYEWHWKGSEDAALADGPADPRMALDRIAYLNAGKDTQIHLNFAQEPDKLLVEHYTSADGYGASVYEEVVGNALPAPLDGNDHLYTVKAVWLEDRDADSWGSCTYDFRFLSQGVVSSTATTMPEYSDLDLYQLVQLDSSELMGVEVVNNVEGLNKTCRTQKDKQAILDFLKNNLATEFVPISVAAPEADYMLRLVCVDGTQLTVGYGTDGVQSWLLVGGIPYEAGRMDLAALWEGLEAGTLSQEAVQSGKHYLAMSDVFPGDDWGSDFVYGYLTQLDTSAVYDEMRWLDDTTAPNGYRLEKGWANQSGTVSADCEYWILDEHDKPYCQVTAADLWKWSQNTDVLFRIYTRDDQIIAICEQYQP